MSLLSFFQRKKLPPHLMLGMWGEKQAAKFLHRKGWRIVTRNYTTRQGEIDIIADDHGTLVFVEVRTRGPGNYGSAEETIDEDKSNRIVAAADEYLRNWLGQDFEYRFDIVAVAVDRKGKLKEIQHYPGGI